MRGLTPWLIVGTWLLPSAWAAPGPPDHAAGESAACSEQALVPESIWASPAARAARRRQLEWLAADEARFFALRRSSDWNPTLIKYQLVGADLGAALAKLLAADAAVSTDEVGRVVYSSRETGVSIVENIWSHTFEIERRLPGEPVRYLKPNGRELRTRELSHRHLRIAYSDGSLTESPMQDYALYRRLILGSFGGASHWRRSVHSRGWRRSSLAEAVLRFVGTDSSKVTVRNRGHKIMIANREHGFTILDDPHGQYFRVLRTAGLGKVPVEWDGYLRRHETIGDETHFYYGDSEGSAALDASFWALPRAPTFTAPEGDPAGDPMVQEYFAQQGFATRIITRERVKMLASVRWNVLNEAAREQVLRRAYELDPLEASISSALLGVASRSGDLRWEKVLGHWRRQLATDQRGWAQMFAAQVEKLEKDFLFLKAIPLWKAELAKAEAGAASQISPEMFNAGAYILKKNFAVDSSAREELAALVGRTAAVALRPFSANDFNLLPGSVRLAVLRYHPRPLAGSRLPEATLNAVLARMETILAEEPWLRPGWAFALREMQRYPALVEKLAEWPARFAIPADALREASARPPGRRRPRAIRE